MSVGTGLAQQAGPIPPCGLWLLTLVGLNDFGLQKRGREGERRGGKVGGGRDGKKGNICLFRPGPTFEAQLRETLRSPVASGNSSLALCSEVPQSTTYSTKFTVSVFCALYVSTFKIYPIPRNMFLPHPTVHPHGILGLCPLGPVQGGVYPAVAVLRCCPLCIASSAGVGLLPVFLTFLSLRPRTVPVGGQADVDAAE